MPASSLPASPRQPRFTLADVFLWLKVASLACSLLLWLLLSISYYFRPDSCAAITVFPVWIWLFPGLCLSAFSWKRTAKRKLKRLLAGNFLLWLSLLVFAEEPMSLLRSRAWPSTKWQTARQSGRAIRLVSLNCASSSQALAEVTNLAPDIVLLQESPDRRVVLEWARHLWGDEATVLWGADASLLARGVMSPIASPRSLQMRVVQARFEGKTSLKLNLISLHLMTPPLRVDLWSPACWKAQTLNRRLQREQMSAIRQSLQSLSSDAQTIVGGDFNAPQGDAIFRYLRPRLHDTFRQGGSGWGNTISNDFPVLRIDQIWVSESLVAANVIARRTQYSDHRMVICDLLLHED